METVLIDAPIGMLDWKACETCKHKLGEMVDHSYCAIPMDEFIANLTTDGDYLNCGHFDESA